MIELKHWQDNSTLPTGVFGAARTQSVEQFCDTHCKTCSYEDCEISHDPSCKRSRELKIKLEPEA